MDEQTLRELSAAYALNALDPDEERDFEAALARDPRLQEEVAALREAAAALAYDVDAPPPPPGLPERILESARAERTNVVPLRPRWAVPAAAVAAIAACAAIGLGIWAATLQGELDDERAAAAGQAEVVAVLTAGDAERVPLDHGEGALVVTPSEDAVLVLDGLEPAPEGKTYQAWVITGGVPESAGIFEAGDGRTTVALDRPVPDGAVVAVTVEQDGGVDQPTGTPLAASQTV